jgi:isoamylase
MRTLTTDRLFRYSLPWWPTILLLLALLAMVGLSLLIPSVKAQGNGKLGAIVDSPQNTITFRVYSSAATHLEVWIYNQPLGTQEKLRLPLTQDSVTKIWSVTVSKATLETGGLRGTVYYGYRAWGPNWTFNPAWAKGSNLGFKQDIDERGNRFNPNKLLLDPYALEVSHDPLIPVAAGQTDASIYQSGPNTRSIDTGAQAPKGIVLAVATSDSTLKPTRPFKDEIIYEVHLRGLTKNDRSIPEELRGTYAGAARKANYLKELGVTAVEFLPVQETQNDTNDVIASTEGDNYWGYDTYNYFAPDRRYSFDKSPGGPTKEFKEMIKAFHAQGLKVYIDVVYNHTGEGNSNHTCEENSAEDVSKILSWRGLDNVIYYELCNNASRYFNNNGVSPNFNTAHPIVRNFIIDSLTYWKNSLGVDGFRFDLAPILGNSCAKDCFNYDKLAADNVLNRAVRELPVRPEQGGAGVDLIAEPWTTTSYQFGEFPSGWAEWNDKFRDAFRRAQNKLDISNIPPGELAIRLAGSSDYFQDDGRKPWHSVNFIVAHDGFTLRDLYSFNEKTNEQLVWDRGPSPGGRSAADEMAWDQGGDPLLQRQAARTGLALLMLSAGVPMVTGGDEMYRTQHGNNNAFNVDSPANWLDYDNINEQPHFFNYAKKLFAFRTAHPALRTAKFFSDRDTNANGLKNLTWLQNNAQEPNPSYFQDPNQHFLAYRIDGSEFGDSAQSIYVAYNGWKEPVTAILPSNVSGKRWYRVADTAGFMEDKDNFNSPGAEEQLSDQTYDLVGRSLLLLIEK